MKGNVIHRINAVFCGFLGVFSLFLAYNVISLATDKDLDLPPDEAGLVPYVIAYCVFYGLVCLFYAYCRFFYGRENNPLLIFCRRWLIYIAALFAHGLTLIWAVPVLIGLTDLRLPFALPIGFLVVVNVFTDSAPYLKALGIWVKDALFTKKKK